MSRHNATLAGNHGRADSEGVRMLKEWHHKFSVPIKDSPQYPGEKRAMLRAELITEESQEFASACLEGNLVEMADALGDLLYVVIGAALECGIPADAVLAEVHRSNMTKVWADGTVHYREDGKVLKPPTYSRADVAGVLRAHGWQG